MSHHSEVTSRSSRGQSEVICKKNCKYKEIAIKINRKCNWNRNCKENLEKFIPMIGRNSTLVLTGSHLDPQFYVLVQILHSRSCLLMSYLTVASYFSLSSPWKRFCIFETHISLAGWQWCWWRLDVGDFMMVTDFGCWWQNHYVGDFLRYVGNFLNVFNRSPTSWIGHQHDKLVTNTLGLQHSSPTSM